MEDKAVEGCEPRLHIFWRSAGKALPKIGHLSEDTGLCTDFDLTPVKESTHWQELWEKKKMYLIFNHKKRQQTQSQRIFLD